MYLVTFLYNFAESKTPCVSSLQKVVERNDGQEEVCDERDGWCIVGTTDKLRDLITGMIRKLARNKKPCKDNIQSHDRRPVSSFIPWTACPPCDHTLTTAAVTLIKHSDRVPQIEHVHSFWP